MHSHVTPGDPLPSPADKARDLSHSQAWEQFCLSFKCFCVNPLTRRVSRFLWIRLSWQRPCWAGFLGWHPLEVQMSSLVQPRAYKIFLEHKTLIENWRQTVSGSLLLFTLLSYSNTQRSTALTVNTLNLAALKLFFTQPSLRELRKPYRDIPNLCMPIYVAASKQTLSTHILLKIRFYLLITVLMLSFKFKRSFSPSGSSCLLPFESIRGVTINL